MHGEKQQAANTKLSGKGFFFSAIYILKTSRRTQSRAISDEYQRRSSQHWEAPPAQLVEAKAALCSSTLGPSISVHIFISSLSSSDLTEIKLFSLFHHLVEPAISRTLGDGSLERPRSPLKPPDLIKIPSMNVWMSFTVISLGKSCNLHSYIKCFFVFFFIFLQNRKGNLYCLP